MSLFSFWKKKSHKRRSGKNNDRLAKTLPGKRTPAENIKGQKSGAFASWASRVNWPVFRINLVIGFFCVIWIVLWGRAWYLQMIEGPRLADRARRQHMASELVSGKRGLIYDRNGQVLARSVEARSIYAKPAEVIDIQTAANTLAPILDMEPDKLVGALSGKRKFIWLKRKVDDSTAEKVRKASLAGIGLSHEYDRFYPFKQMAGQVLGFVGMDDRGLEGIERSLDSRLGAMPVRQIVQRDAMGRKFYLHDSGQAEPAGENVTLTLDMNIQFIAEEAVAKAVREFDAKWGGALVIDVNTGDILAWAQYPFFNPNSYRNSSPQVYRNRLAADALEPGSTFKPIVMAAALQEKKVTPNTLINCEGGKWTNRNLTIRDTSTRDILPASKVIRYSSNIGMAKIGLAMGSRQFHKYLSELGFGETIPVPVSNSRGILRAPRDWSEADIMATSFGQSISVTGLQMAQAYLTLLNNGVFKPLRLIIEDENVMEQPRRIFSATSAREVMDMMRDVVEEKDGTGKRARIEGIETGGKTGTAQKADRRLKAYGEKRLASFVGFFPAKNPHYLILVIIDEPSRNQYGGIVAAPAFREIGEKLLTQTGILNESVLAQKPAQNGKTQRVRGLKLAANLSVPWSAKPAPAVSREKKGMNLPGHLAKAAGKVPDVMGKSVRNAVELFARAGIVPELKGTGSRVVKQTPPAGSPWPENGKKSDYILWLSER